jgi:RimJ/RimL family protein N-acetyltransferase
MSYGRSAFGLGRIVAVISPKNDASRRVLEKLGFTLERTVRLATGAEELLLFGAAA